MIISSLVTRQMCRMPVVFRSKMIVCYCDSDWSDVHVTKKLIELTPLCYVTKRHTSCQTCCGSIQLTLIKVLHVHIVKLYTCI